MSMTLTWTLGELIAKARRDAGLEQAELAEKVGIARNTISNYERDKTMPPLDVAVKIATACGVDLELLATASTAETTDQKVRGSSPFGRTQSVETGQRPVIVHDAGRFWSPDRALSLAMLWCQLDVDAELLDGIEDAR